MSLSESVSIVYFDGPRMGPPIHRRIETNSKRFSYRTPKYLVAQIRKIFAFPLLTFMLINERKATLFTLRNVWIGLMLLIIKFRTC